jgi:cellulose biosynthesis protein BcsQ
MTSDVTKVDCKIIACGGPKGGGGKTKINLSVACTLAMRPERPRVLLVDLCQDQGMLSYMLAPNIDMEGHGVGELIVGVLQNKPSAWLVDKFKVAKVKVNVSLTEDVTMDFLPAAADILGELTINNMWVEKERGTLLSGALGPIIDAFNYDYIVIDTIPLARLHTTASVMNIADALAIVLDVQNEENVAGADRFMSYVRQHNAKIEGVIQNLYDPRMAA